MGSCTSFLLTWTPPPKMMLSLSVGSWTTKRHARIKELLPEMGNELATSSIYTCCTSGATKTLTSYPILPIAHSRPNPVPPHPGPPKLSAQTLILYTPSPP